LTGQPVRNAWEGKYITVKVEGTWEYVSRANNMGAAVILAIDGGHVLLVEQYRVPLKRYCLELPAGLVGDEGAPEESVDAARRELEEETGYRAEVMTEIGQFYSSPGMVSESFTLFRASGLARVHEGGGTGDEAITVHRVPLADIAAFVAAKRAENVGIDVRVMSLLAMAGALGL